MINNKWSIIGVALITGTYLYLANDGRHHWHEFRYLYASAFYTTDELMKGRFDPGPAPERTEREVAEWYSSELFHMYLLKNLIKHFGITAKNYAMIKYLYGITIVLAVAILAIMCRLIGMSSFGSYTFFFFFLLSPLSVYLGFKFLAEVPAALFAAIGITAFALILQYYTLRYVLSIFSGIWIALSALTSAKMILVFVGFFISFVFLLTAKKQKKDVAVLYVLATSTFVFVWYAGLRQLGGSTDIIASGISSFRSFTKDLPMWIFSVFNAGLFGMGLWFLFPFAWFSREDRLRRFFAVWFCLSAVPTLLGAANFLEPRYLVACIIPFIGLTSIGFEAIVENMKRSHRKSAAIALFLGVVGAVTIGGTASAQYVMPYELDDKLLIRAVRDEMVSSKTDVVLVPWNYSDYHFLYILFPDKNIYLVQAATNSRGEIIEDRMWTKRYKNIYGSRFVPDERSLEKLESGKMVFIGWTIMPSIENIRKFLLAIRMNDLASRIENARLMNHMTQTWLWENPRYALREKSRYGQYHVYEVVDRAIVSKN